MELTVKKNKIEENKIEDEKRRCEQIRTFLEDPILKSHLIKPPFDLSFIKLEDATIWCHRTDQKIKLYCFRNKPFVSTPTSLVFRGWKINGKHFAHTRFLKKKILKQPTRTARANILESEAKALVKLTKDGLIPGIQARFDVLRYQNFQQKTTTCLVNDEYEASLTDIPLKTMKFYEKIHVCQQLALALQELQRRNFFATDIKLQNIVWKKNEDEFEVVHIDVGAISKNVLNKKISDYNMLTPAAVTDRFVHNADLFLLSTAIKNKNPEEYFSVAQKMMVYELGVVFFYLFTSKYLVKKEVSTYFIGEKTSCFSGACLSQEEIDKRLDKVQDSQMQLLLGSMLNLDCKQRIHIDEVCNHLIMRVIFSQKESSSSRKRKEKEEDLRDLDPSEMRNWNLGSAQDLGFDFSFESKSNDSAELDISSKKKTNNLKKEDLAK